MKKITILLLCIVCSVFVYAASTLLIVDTVKPDIDATFNETVTLLNFNLIYSATSESIELNNRTTDNKTFIFTPKKSLMNGFYSFVVNAKDKIGNEKVFTKNLVIDVKETEIYFIRPLHGVGQTQEFDIFIGTTRTASCKWSFFDSPYELMSAFTKSANTEHLIEKFMATNNVDRQEEAALVPIHVKCIDEFGFNITKQLFTGYDTSAPVIKRKTAIENPVVSYYPQPQSTIMLETDDNSICYVDKINDNDVPNIIFDNQNRLNFRSYIPLSRYTVSYDPPDTRSNRQYKYQVFCENWAGGRTFDEITITVALQEKLTITVLSPQDFIRGELVYHIKTNKPASCDVVLDGKLPAQGICPFCRQDFTLSHGTISEGSHIAKFSCRGGFAATTETAEVTKTFVVDITPPSQPVVNATACKADTINLAFSANDTQSGILGFNYSITGTNVSVNWTFTSSAKTDQKNLKMVLREAYSVQAYAINKAGAPSTTSGSTTFTFNPNITIACQEKNAPIITFNVSDFGAAKQVAINCFDESGCVSSSIKYGLSANKTCTPSITAAEAILEKPQYICAEAEDIYQNKGSKVQLIDFKVVGGGEIGDPCTSNAQCEDNYCANNKCATSSCTDNIKNGFETDIDCGGFACGACAINQTCTKNSDCKTNSCTIAGVCEQTSCTDKIKNGLETDIDCGGTDCNKCPDGNACEAGTDCKSGSCQFFSCVVGEKTFEDWATENGIDPTDKDGDADGDGLSNYNEFLKGTNPNNKDTDEDGFSDGAEVKAETDPLDAKDFPVSLFPRYLLLLLGAVIIAIGLLFLFYFKIDTTTSMNIILIGAAALLFALVDWLLIILPRPLLIAIALLSVAGTGYFVYIKRTVIMQAGKAPPTKAAAMMRAQGVERAAPTLPEMREAKREKEELAATKQMIEMLKKQRAEQQAKREEVFGRFRGEAKKAAEKPKVMALEPIRKGKVVEKAKPTKLTLPKREEAKPVEKAVLERLAKLGETKKLSEFERLKAKEDAFGKLGSFTRSKAEEIFKRLPSSEKGKEALEELGKKKKKK